MDIIAGLKDSRNSGAYEWLLLLEEKSAVSNELYACFEDYVALTKSKSSLVRTRGFRLACAQARWDTENQLDRDFDTLLLMLDDEKATAVRQCLAALHLVVPHKPNLVGRIENKLNSMDLSKYRDSMRPLIQKDMEALRAVLR